METMAREDVRAHVVRHALRRRYNLILLVTLLVGGVAFAAAQTQKPEFTATARVLLRPIPGNSLSNDTVRNAQQVTVAMETEASIVASPEVVDLASVNLRSNIPMDFSSVSAVVPPNTEIVEVRFRAADRDAAERGARAFAQAYLDYREGQARTVLDSQLEVLNAQATAASDALQRVAVPTGDSTTLSPDAAARVQLFTNRLSGIQEQIGALQSQSTVPGSVISPATAPNTPSGISPLLLLGGGLFMGLLLGAAIAIARERNDDRVLADADVTINGLPVLSQLPQAHADHESLLIDGVERADRVVLAYRRARAGLTVRLKPRSVIAVSAVRTTEDTSRLVTANLALSLASAQHRVCVIDALPAGEDSLDALFGLEVGEGLSELLESPLPVVLRLPRAHGVSVLGYGSSAGKSHEALASSGFATLVARLRTEFDYVLVAAGFASTPSANEVAIVSDGSVLVVEDTKTRHSQVEAALFGLEQLGTEVIGTIVVNRVRQPREARPHPTPGAGPATTSATASELVDPATDDHEVVEHADKS